MRNTVLIMQLILGLNMSHAHASDSFGAEAYKCMSSIGYSCGESVNNICVHSGSYVSQVQYDDPQNDDLAFAGKPIKNSTIYKVFQGKAGSLDGLYLLAPDGTTHFYPFIKLSSCITYDFKEKEYAIDLSFKGSPPFPFLYSPDRGSVTDTLNTNAYERDGRIKRVKHCTLNESENISEDSKPATLAALDQAFKKQSKYTADYVGDISEFKKMSSDNPKLSDFASYRLNQIREEVTKARSQLSPCLSSIDPSIRSKAKEQLDKLPDVDKLLGISTTEKQKPSETAVPVAK